MWLGCLAAGKPSCSGLCRMPHGLLEPHLDVVPPDPGLNRVRADACLYRLRGLHGQPSGLDFLPGAGFEGEQVGREVDGGHRGILSRRRHVPAFDLAQLGQQPLILGPLCIRQPDSRMSARPGPQCTYLLVQLGGRPRGTRRRGRGHVPDSIEQTGRKLMAASRKQGRPPRTVIRKDLTHTLRWPTGVPFQVSSKERRPV